MQSTPAEVQSISENDFECFASTGVNTPGTMFQIRVPTNIRFPTADLRTNVVGVRVKHTFEFACSYENAWSGVLASRSSGR